MKIKLVVITVDEKRQKYIEEQLKELNISSEFEVDYFKGFTPSDSKEYINYKDEIHPELDTTMCCFRSFFAVFEKYSKLDYDYIITIEDDISILKTSSFKNKIETT